MRNVLAEDTNREELTFSLTHLLTPDLQIGLEHGVTSNDYYPVMNYRLREAKDGMPAFLPEPVLPGHLVKWMAMHFLSPQQHY